MRFYKGDTVCVVDKRTDRPYLAVVGQSFDESKRNPFCLRLRQQTPIQIGENLIWEEELIPAPRGNVSFAAVLNLIDELE